MEYVMAPVELEVVVAENGVEVKEVGGLTKLTWSPGFAAVTENVVVMEAVA
jgi:hypothetical protein